MEVTVLRRALGKNFPLIANLAYNSSEEFHNEEFFSQRASNVTARIQSLSFTITYGAERYATTLPVAASTQVVGALLPAAALKGIRELADPRGESASGLAQQVFGRKKATELVARSRASELQASAVGASNGSGHLVTVHQTAKAAATMSAGFAEGETLRGGTLSFAIDGRDYSVGIAAGGTLADVADAIRGAGADLDVSVAVEDGQQRLSLVRRSTGYLRELGADSAFSVSESYAGGEGRTLDLNRVQAAQNARVTVDQQTIERRSNTINDAVAGTTIRIDDSTGRSQVLDGRNAATLARNNSVSAFTVSVQQIAAAAEARSTEFTSPYEQVQAGKVLIKVDGGQYWIPVNEGASLVQTAASINASGAPVQARLERSDSGVSIALTAKNTGFEPGTDAAAALQVSFEGTGFAGKALGFSVVRQAQNAKVSLNGQAIESRSNELVGAEGIPRLSLKETTSAPQLQGEMGANNAVTAKPNDRPNATAHIARLLQEQVVALATQPLQAEVVAAQAKKLYTPPAEDKNAPASSVAAKATSKLKTQNKPSEAAPSRAPSVDDDETANSSIAAAMSDVSEGFAVEAVAPANARDGQAKKGALGAILESLKSSRAASVSEKPSPYAPPKEEKAANGLTKETPYGFDRHALGRKAKQAYAQRAA